jgi:D-3-phosphoglycerate dehydrogenase
MDVAILDDWFDTLRTLPCFVMLTGHKVPVFNDHMRGEHALEAELTFGLVRAAMQQIPQQMKALRASRRMIGVGHTVRGKTFGVHGHIRRTVAGLHARLRHGGARVGAQILAGFRPCRWPRGSGLRISAL